jgi:hypothetical protein
MGNNVTISGGPPRLVNVHGWARDTQSSTPGNGGESRMRPH